jgi:hypothetical protein
LSEEAAFNKALKSSVYHHKLKGCQLAHFKVTEQIRERGETITVERKKAKCRTHDAIVCYALGDNGDRCYWQQFWHYGSYSSL